MNDYQKYLELLKQQAADLKTDSYLAQIRTLLDSHREILCFFRAVKHEIDDRLARKSHSAEELRAFISDLEKHLGHLGRLREILDDLSHFTIIGQPLKNTIRQLGEYCMNNLSLDDILKASAGAENLKQQATEQQNEIEKIQAAYLIHQGLISFFAGIEKQFKSLMQTGNINAKTADAFLMLFEQHIKDLSGLKFQIGRTKSSGYAELENMVRYCREEMTLYEVQHCLKELDIVQQEGQQRLADEAERKKQEELKRQEKERKQQEEERKRQEELIIQEEERKKKGIYTNSLGMTFRLIPSGTFMMGSPEDEDGRIGNEVLHRVTISKPFYMQTTQVTQKQWQAIMGNNPSNFGSCGEGCPIEQVPWNHVQQFIERLNKSEGKNKYRLPTEAEWEYACRAGSATAYCFGNDESRLKEYAWYEGNSGDKTHPVGLLKPNAWGLYDMHGNVWEWCKDWYAENYPSGSVTDPIGPSTGSDRVFRGGGWVSDAGECRAASRYGDSPNFGITSRGFRLVLSP